MQIVDVCTKMSQDDIKERFQLKKAATTVTTATRSAMFSFQMLQTSSEKKRKACQYVTCIGTMLFFDGAGTVGSGETALEAACAGCHRCIYIVRMRS